MYASTRISHCSAPTPNLYSASGYRRSIRISSQPTNAVNHQARIRNTSRWKRENQPEGRRQTIALGERRLNRDRHWIRHAHILRRLRSRRLARVAAGCSASHNASTCSGLTQQGARGLTLRSAWDLRGKVLRTDAAKYFRTYAAKVLLRDAPAL